MTNRQMLAWRIVWLAVLLWGFSWALRHDHTAVMWVSLAAVLIQLGFIVVAAAKVQDDTRAARLNSQLPDEPYHAADDEIRSRS